MPAKKSGKTAAAPKAGTARPTVAHLTGEVRALQAHVTALEARLAAMEAALPDLTLATATKDRADDGDGRPGDWIATRLLAVRSAAGIGSWAEFARRIDASPKTVEKWAQGLVGELQAKSVDAIVDAFGVDRQLLTVPTTDWDGTVTITGPGHRTSSAPTTPAPAAAQDTDDTDTPEPTVVTPRRITPQRRTSTPARRPRRPVLTSTTQPAPSANEPEPASKPGPARTVNAALRADDVPDHLRAELLQQFPDTPLAELAATLAKIIAADKVPDRARAAVETWATAAEEDVDRRRALLAAVDQHPTATRKKKAS